MTKPLRKAGGSLAKTSRFRNHTDDRCEGAGVGTVRISDGHRTASSITGYNNHRLQVNGVKGVFQSGKSCIFVFSSPYVRPEMGLGNREVESDRYPKGFFAALRMIEGACQLTGSENGLFRDSSWGKMCSVCRGQNEFRLGTWLLWQPLALA